MFDEYDEDKVNFTAGRVVSAPGGRAPPKGPGKQGRIDVTVFRPARPSKTPPATAAAAAASTPAPPPPPPALYTPAPPPLLPGRAPLFFINQNQEQHACYCDPLSRREQKELERREKQRAKAERQLRREKKRRRLQQCLYERMNCFSHDNAHWKTAPFWTEGPFCFCMNANNNTYSCLRTINATHNFLYCEFVTGLITFYNLRIDPFEQWNRVHSLSSDELSYLHNTLVQLKGCKGTRQCTVGSAAFSEASKADAAPQPQPQPARAAPESAAFGHSRAKKKKFAAHNHGEGARHGKNTGIKSNGRGEDASVSSTKITAKTTTSDGTTNTSLPEPQRKHRFSEPSSRHRGESRRLRHKGHLQSHLEIGA